MLNELSRKMFMLLSLPQELILELLSMMSDSGLIIIGNINRQFRELIKFPWLIKQFDYHNIDGQNVLKQKLFMTTMDIDILPLALPTTNNLFDSDDEILWCVSCYTANNIIDQSAFAVIFSHGIGICGKNTDTAWDILCRNLQRITPHNFLIRFSADIFNLDECDKIIEDCKNACIDLLSQPPYYHHNPDDNSDENYKTLKEFIVLCFRLASRYILLYYDRVVKLCKIQLEKTLPDYRQQWIDTDHMIKLNPECAFHKQFKELFRDK